MSKKMSSAVAEALNIKRAHRAITALAAYKQTQLGESGPVCRDTLVDLLVDLRHALDVVDLGITLEEALRISEDHYTIESAEAE